MMGAVEGNKATTTTVRPIERLPVRKPTSSDQKEAMNCRSCRKRKIKCNRLKPSCEACQVFNCPCVYDAIPKKRGPKTDVLEALLKRVNGLEKRLKDEQKSVSPEAESSSSSKEGKPVSVSDQNEFTPSLPDARAPQPETQATKANSVSIEVAPQMSEAVRFTDALLNTFFARVHNKPYYILDEAATRQRLRDGRLPQFLVDAIHAVSIRYVPHLCGGHGGAIRSSHDHAFRSRAGIDVDEPNIDNLQALLLLAMANFQNGKGKKCYMVLTHAVSMAFALNLHRELPPELRITNSEREGRRKLFWTCYVMDRFTVSGSSRPLLISDESISLRLPGWQPPGSHLWVEGNFFSNGSSLRYGSGVSNTSLGSGTILIEIVRVLGMANRYLGARGVKDDSYFPWHAQSTLSRIRSDLDYWAAATQDVFTSIGTLFGSPESSTLVLSKLIYHTIHCLIYRPFLPIDLNELSGSWQSQSWQIEATNVCFLNANAIAELVEIGNKTALLDWPSFVGYCICTAGTVHVHGAHYMAPQESDAFCHSAKFLSREMGQLFDLCRIWAGVQHQRDTLQTVYASHAHLVNSLASNSVRFALTFQMEDFFDRYPGTFIDGSHTTFSDIIIDTSHECMPVNDEPQQLVDYWNSQSTPEVMYYPTILPQQTRMPAVNGKSRKRRSTASSLPYPTPKTDCSMPDTLAGKQPQHISDIGVQIQDHDGTIEEQELNPTPFQGTVTSNFAFNHSQSTLALTADSNGYGQLSATPSFERSAASGGCGGFAGSIETEQNESENDPFLSLLEQMAENDTSRLEGAGDFDFFTRGEL